MQAPIRGLTERSGEVFLLDILSHRMSVTGCYDRNAGWLLDGSMAQLGCVLGSPKEEKDEQEPDCFCFLLVCGLVALGSASAQQRAASRTGWISDESCGTQHTKPERADCVQKCWRGGASVGHPEWKPQRAVFVADDDQAIWICRNPEAV